MKENRTRVVKEKGLGSRLNLVSLGMLFAAIVATPLFFLVGFIYNRILMATRQFRLKNSQYDFWLTPEQCMEYLKKTNRYNEVKKLLSSAKGDARAAVYDEYKPIRNSLERDLEGLQALPRENFREFRDIVARTNAFLLCLITWCAVIVYFHLPIDERTIGTISDQYTQLALYLPHLVSAGGNPQPLGHDLIWSIANATFWPILLYYPFKQIAAPLVYFYSKKPDKVNFGSVSASFDSGQVKAAFVATVAANLEPIVEILDDPGAFESEI